MKIAKVERVVLDLASIRRRIGCLADLELNGYDAATAKENSIKPPLNSEERVLE
jgi:hypothetical protein